MTRQILILVDCACQGAGSTVRTPYKNHREQPKHYQQFNRDNARLRASGQRALTQTRAMPDHTPSTLLNQPLGTIIQALQALHALLACGIGG